jgi:hypothetical protein
MFWGSGGGWVVGGWGRPSGAGSCGGKSGAAVEHAAVAEDRGVPGPQPGLQPHGVAAAADRCEYER